MDPCNIALYLDLPRLLRFFPPFHASTRPASKNRYPARYTRSSCRCSYTPSAVGSTKLR